MIREQDLDLIEDGLEEYIRNNDDAVINNGDIYTIINYLEAKLAKNGGYID